MSIHVAINHKTEYRFDRLVRVAPHLIRLRPTPHSRTPILSYSLKVEPEEHFVNWQQDPFGNYIARFVFPEKTRRLSIDVDLVAEMTVINPFDFFVEESAEHLPFEYEPLLAGDLAPYLDIEEDGPLLGEWLRGVELNGRRTVDFLVDLNARLSRDIGYVIRMEHGVQTCEETLSLAKGSCRDSAWLLVQILRHLGLAARFVSGYLVQLTADMKSLDGPSGPEADFTDLHAWAEVYVPGAGWLGLDATSGLFAGEGHIPLACTPHPASAAPVTGVTDPCKVDFYFHNKVQRIHEDPRVTRPFDDGQWRRIDALGEQVDARLKDLDVRLTMGGEPTFVSIDDMDGAQWNIEALGDDKRRLSEELLLRLRDRFATGGIVHRGQGKWYPGEPVPRWALAVLWRTDGQPMLRNPGVIDEAVEAPGFDASHARQFITALSRKLGLDDSYIVPGYEDVYYYLWREGALPDNVDPHDSRLDDPLERDRLRRLFGAGLKELRDEVGFALPLKYDRDLDGWRSSLWSFRRQRMYLLPGDSPMGFRLPLASLPWVDPEHREVEPEPDPFAPAPPIDFTLQADARGRHVVADGPAGARGEAAPAAAKSETAREIIHTALCVEPREGRLHVFMPPVKELREYLKLIDAIETAAGETGVRIVLEGYEPPQDTRLERLRVTPDPGVIEVNVHPARGWRELVDNTETLYEQARQARLGTEKFMLDGRHTGTGGGNHVTIGGPTAADSPVLRRPDLLRSLVGYWQNHPSLSFLFSGAFIGPTSQAPRVDEARDDSLYELEIAFQQIPRGEVPAPWLVDRLLRNLLVDMTGNTHRSEFCIDKLYSPESPAGRLGLVEFRAFEMPPHARMSLVQMLLLRGLIARFWEEPYERPLVRWGTALHDRFMLPHFVWEDFKEVIAGLRAAGYPFELEWFAPFLEFRFPRLGTAQVKGMETELRWALEPWHVLGEQISAQGTARYVDSSVERLQLKVRGLVSERYAVTCNGRRLPLRPTDERGEYVAGVRYKAWDPPSGLHPALPAQQRLVFDVVDQANRRSLGGFTYNVTHPGGRNYETFPVNANEAEARRNARFWSHGHSQGQLDVPSDEPAGDHPYTLDLRYRNRG